MSLCIPRRVVVVAVTFGLVLCGCGVTSAHPDSTTRTASHGRIAALIAKMSLRQKVGQMMMVSIAGTTLSPQARTMIKQIQPGGITLFGDNFSSPSQLTTFDSSVQGASHVPMIISVDQEGGEVVRVTSGVKQLPSEYAYGQQDNPAQVRVDAATEGKQLRKLGINMDLAPVLDVATQNSVIGEYDRSYGANSAVDTALGLAAIKGYQGHGIATVAKHVVGLGTTLTDPESTLPTLNLTAKQLANQLAPFKAAAKAGVDGIMVTHVILNGISKSPASISHAVVTGILRKQFGYKGVIMTDSLTMGALSQYGVPRVCKMAVGAGEDVLLIAAGGATNTTLYSRCLDAVLAKYRAGGVAMTQINASVTRILSLKRKLGLALPTD